MSPVVESEEGTSKQTFTKDSLAPTDKTETIETPNRQRRQSVNWDESILEASDQQIDLGLGSLSAASKQVIFFPDYRFLLVWLKTRIESTATHFNS